MHPPTAHNGCMVLLFLNLRRAHSRRTTFRRHHVSVGATIFRVGGGFLGGADMGCDVAGGDSILGDGLDALAGGKALGLGDLYKVCKLSLPILLAFFRRFIT